MNFILELANIIFYERAQLVSKLLFSTRKHKFVSSSHRKVFSLYII